MSTEFHVDHEQIRAHASTVAGLSDGLSSTARAVAGGPAGNALGSFVEFATLGFGEAMTQAAQAVSAASGALDSVSRGLARSAEDYQRADDEGVALLAKEDR
ncbi:type VII secretion target [Saccharopolyspora sp. TS4A08]|uniref:Type VII secretion target n=1 Tax=Saccharopolyspora ipomoeae TaxID=3042027 RepID=A0ABT6PSQ8_9PSEU|nr:type VII secretion target [Saccharopolyspora sp. TS4A08]MDI2031040.1 type VII secretion target [Saccharopolyspora sp. TS4A08]